ncbi:hypothetical protein KKG45_04805 [bacterium]|nr:hypothetical protein [bacterium]MBU1072549.1 hypothetical protein [bacterium]MBU1675008.1 hypothetical protein [bacterium]
MRRGNGSTLSLRPDGGGWSRDGKPWEPDGPFYAVLGDPVDHSLSPLFQSAAMRAEGLPYAYHAVRTSRADLARIFRDRGGLALRGFNVTAPHKFTAADLCPVLTAEARLTGAVNTVRLTEGGWEGHNTDVGGLCEVLDDLIGRTPAGHGLVLGAGGAARAAVVALLESGADGVCVMARSGSGFEAMSGWLAADAMSGRRVRLVDWGAPLAEHGMASGFVCVSCLPGGVDLASLAPAGGTLQPALWLDMNYASRAVAPPGVPANRIHDGLPVLLAQGALSFSWWFDRDAPRRVMAEALAGA